MLLTCTPVSWHCSSTSCAVKDATAGAPGTSGQQEDVLGSAGSSLTDLPVDEECSGTSRLPAADSEDGFSYNEDDTESQEVGCCLCFARSLAHSPIHAFIHSVCKDFLQHHSAANRHTRYRVSNKPFTLQRLPFP